MVDRLEGSLLLILFSQMLYGTLTFEVCFIEMEYLLKSDSVGQIVTPVCEVKLGVLNFAQ